VAVVTTLKKNNNNISSVLLLLTCLHTLASIADYPVFWHGTQYSGAAGVDAKPLLEVTHDEP